MHVQAVTLSNKRSAVKGRRFRRTRFPIPCYLHADLFGKLETLKLLRHQTWAELLQELAEYAPRCRAARVRAHGPLPLGTGPAPMPVPPKPRKGLPETMPEHGAGAVL